MNVLIIGATSAIAIATARLYAKEGATLFLVARDPSRLDTVARDLEVHGAAAVHNYRLDLRQLTQHPLLIAKSVEALGRIDVALIAHGTLPDQKACEGSVEATLDSLNTNCLSVISLLTLLSALFATQDHGTIAVVSSVSGDRGRQSNYVYGTAKAAVNTFLQGIRNRFGASNVSVITIKPGFVDTPMTACLKKGLLFVSSERAGKEIHQAISRKLDVAYIPWFWKWIMLVIRAIPESVFKKLKL